jgi:1-acyl-sn-glycerol-3-phosphate acyltransferase
LPVKLWFNWRFEGLERIPETGPVLVAGNHISYLDPFAHAYFLVKRHRRPRFLAKGELFDIPVVGWVLGNGGQIPVRRGTGDETPLAQAERALAGGEAVVVYPEGTVTTDPSFLPMRGKTGVVRLSLASGVPITPVATLGGQHVWQKSGRRSLKFARPIWVKAGPPIDLSAHHDQADDVEMLRKLTDEVMAALTVLVTQLRAAYPKRWA